MDEDIFSIRLSDVKKDIYNGIAECSVRGLLHTAKWLAELNHGLDKKAAGLAGHSPPVSNPHVDGISATEYDAYFLAKSYYDCREYDRSAFFTQNCTSKVPHFLHLYASYMAKEKKRLDNMTDTANLSQTGNVKDLSELLSTLKSLYATRSMDGYMMYLYGIVLKKLDLTDLAISMLVESVHATPTLWCSWIELAPLITDRAKLSSLNLPNHWMRHIFIGHSLIELFLNDDGLKIFEELKSVGFSRCVYITSQIAIAYHNKRNVEKAISIFQNLQEVDPYRLDNLDIFSNLLFVKELKKEMAHLAHKAVEINKYRPETCCVIGNYYSIRSEHQKAVTYFQRALKLDPQYLSAWTLMGHEFMEMKNTNAAIQSYRKAVEVNQRDYRAWYGLGQAYEILKMPFYSLMYYKISQQLRPYDSRMLVALGETYERLEKNANALKCFQKACNVGDIEGIALLRLADLYKKLGDIVSAVPNYLNFCADERAGVDKSSLCRAFITLGNYYESIGNFEEASHFAYRCLEYDDTKQEARSLLKTIEISRAQAIADTAANKTTPSTEVPVGNVGTSSGADCNEVSMDESDIVLTDDSMMILNETQAQPE